jgi:hypothetical protein
VLQACPSHPPWFGHSNYIWRRAQVMKLLAMRFLWSLYHFISLRSKFPAQLLTTVC